jgi:hypothetical protein
LTCRGSIDWPFDHIYLFTNIEKQVVEVRLTVQQVDKRVVYLSIFNLMDKKKKKSDSRLIEHAVTHRSKRGRSSSSLKSIVNPNHHNCVFLFINVYINDTSSSLSLIVSSMTLSKVYFDWFKFFVEACEILS